MIECFSFEMPPTLNVIINTARSGRYNSAREKKLWTDAIAFSCYGRHQFSGVVWLEFVWFVKTRSNDADNVSAAAKFIMDGLTQADIIKSDNLKYIMSPVIHWYKKGNNQVEVRISDSPIMDGKEIALSHCPW